MSSDYQYYFNYAKELQMNDQDTDRFVNSMLGTLKESLSAEDEKMWTEFVEKDLAD